MHQISGGAQVPSIVQQQQHQSFYGECYEKNDLDRMKRFSVEDNNDHADSFSSFESAKKRARQEGGG